MTLNPFLCIDLSISDSLRSVRKSVLIYETIILLWSNWCDYKRNLGVEFGEYSLRQYRYAKEYYRIVKEELQILEDE